MTAAPPPTIATMALWTKQSADRIEGSQAKSDQLANRLHNPILRDNKASVQYSGPGSQLATHAEKEVPCGLSGASACEYGEEAVHVRSQFLLPTHCLSFHQTKGVLKGTHRLGTTLAQSLEDFTAWSITRGEYYALEAITRIAASDSPEQ